MEPTRVQKLLSNYGNYSRREAEALIREEKVKVNGEVIPLGFKATVNDKIEIEDKVVKFNLKHEYYLLNKPKGYICSKHDKLGKEVISLIDNYTERNLFTVGRLDVNTTGLIIVTTDGQLSNKINLPTSKIPKTYLAWIDQVVDKDTLVDLKQGTVLEDGYVTKPAKAVKVITNEEGKVLIKMTIQEGKKNQIKRMFEAHNRKVVNLKRVQIGYHKLDGIETGMYKKLSQTEMYEKLGLTPDA